MGPIDALSLAFTGKRVLVTGHTGFKGSWLSLWLKQLGADVYGYALDPPTTPSMFDLCGVADLIDHKVGDIRDYDATNRRMAEVRPDVVFHLAAQPIVRQSYEAPLETLSTNVIGTASVLEAVRGLDAACAVVVVSSDKCYDNREWVWGYRECDPLGGKDPYSMSKGATELVVSAWRHSYFGECSAVRLASARAGNVLGGGDWARDRIMTDLVGALTGGTSLELRNPAATRPWQHVLEPLSGYLLLGARLLGTDGKDYCSAWNFGPASRDVRTVAEVIACCSAAWGADGHWEPSTAFHPSEAGMLSLNCDKAANRLGWYPTWSLERMARETMTWYRAWDNGSGDLRQLTLGQVEAFQADWCTAAALD
jgi:CDP-glucose 4,6-dehydratase